MRDVWYDLTKCSLGTDGHLPLVLDAVIGNAKRGMACRQNKFTDIVCMAKGSAGLLTLIAFADGIPNPDEMEAAIRAFEITDLNKG